MEFVNRFALVVHLLQRESIAPDFDHRETVPVTHENSGVRATRFQLLERVTASAGNDAGKTVDGGESLVEMVVAIEHHLHTGGDQHR